MKRQGHRPSGRRRTKKKPHLGPPLVCRHGFVYNKRPNEPRPEIGDLGGAKAATPQLAVPTTAIESIGLLDHTAPTGYESRPFGLQWREREPDLVNAGGGHYTKSYAKGESTNAQFRIVGGLVHSTNPGFYLSTPSSSDGDELKRTSTKNITSKRRPTGMLGRGRRGSMTTRGSVGNRNVWSGAKHAFFMLRPLTALADV